MSPTPTVNRNDPCPCGSGKKYKKCCLGKAEPKPARAGAAAKSSRGAATARSNPRAALSQAIAHHGAGRLDEAARLYAEVIERKPKEAAALFGLGQIRGQLGNLDDGIDLLRRAIAVDGRRSEYHVSLAALLHLARDADGALECAKRAVAIDPKNAAAHSLEASCHERRNRDDEAMASATRALALAPNDANTGLIMAGLLKRKGDLEGARERLEGLVARSSVQGSIRQGALNELGLVLDKLGRYEEAYEAFRRCGAETERDPLAQRTDKGVWSRRIAAYKKGLTPELVTRWKPQPGSEEIRTPAFLVGFSRSGTTLTEQVLAAHPEIVTSNEKPIIRNTKREMAALLGGGEASGEDVPALLEKIDDGQVDHLRAFFWKEAERLAEADLSGKVFVHKQPLNIIDIGFINAIFPDARVLIALRDPRDVCLSCFMQSFTINTANVNFFSLERTAAFYDEVMDLWLHARGMLSLQYIQIRYEDTVTDLPTQARRVLDLIGAPWDDAVLRFHEKARDRHIATPSYAAVSEPVNTKAIGRWRNYASQFEPVLDRLMRYVEEFGYE